MIDEEGNQVGILTPFDAIKLAKEKGWVELEGSHSVRLTDAGRRLFKAG